MKPLTTHCAMIFHSLLNNISVSSFALTNSSSFAHWLFKTPQAPFCEIFFCISLSFSFIFLVLVPAVATAKYQQNEDNHRALMSIYFGNLVSQ